MHHKICRELPNVRRILSWEKNSKFQSNALNTFKIFCRTENKLLYQSDLTVEQLDELTRITAELTEEAKSMIEDYTNNPSDYHGEVDVDKNLVKGDGVVIHENSPLLDEDDDE